MFTPLPLLRTKHLNQYWLELSLMKLSARAIRAQLLRSVHESFTIDQWSPSIVANLVIFAFRVVIYLLFAFARVHQPFDIYRLPPPFFAFCRPSCPLPASCASFVCSVPKSLEFSDQALRLSLHNQSAHRDLGVTNFVRSPTFFLSFNHLFPFSNSVGRHAFSHSILLFTFYSDKFLSFSFLLLLFLFFFVDTLSSSS